jgi:hypothetical protein
VRRLRFGQDDVRFELRGSKVRLADQPEVNDEIGFIVIYKPAKQKTSIQLNAAIQPTLRPFVQRR